MIFFINKFNSYETGPSHPNKFNILDKKRGVGGRSGDATPIYKNFFSFLISSRARENKWLYIDVYLITSHPLTFIYIIYYYSIKIINKYKYLAKINPAVFWVRGSKKNLSPPLTLSPL